jgi:hypothetical protein
MYTWMGLAHVAVLLLSPAALHNPVVQRQACVLASRVASGLDRLLLIPVRLGGADLTAPDWAQLEMPTDQLVDGTGKDAAPIVAEIMAQIAAQKNSLPLPLPPTWMENQADLITQYLESVDAPTLSFAAQTLDLPPQGTITPESLRILLTMWQSGLDRAIQVLDGIRAKLQGSEAPGTLFDAIAPCWVDPLAARWLAVLPKRPADRRALAMNVDAQQDPYEFIAENFARRALGNPRPDPLNDKDVKWLVIAPTAVNGGSYEELVQEVRDALMAQLCPQRCGDAQFKGLLAARVKRLPVFVAVPMPAPDNQLLAQLRQAFPGVTFLLLTGRQLPPVSSLSNVTLLQPELQADDVWSAYFAIDDARKEFVSS